MLGESFLQVFVREILALLKNVLPRFRFPKKSLLFCESMGFSL